MQPKKDGNFKNLSLWILVIIIILAGIVANYYFASVAWALRAAAGLVIAAVAVGLALLTTQGKRAWVFIKGSRTELRKVVWPTRQETIQTTLVVVGMVIVMALILWGVDSFFLWGISWLTGQRG